MEIDTVELFRSEGFVLPIEGEVDLTDVDYYGTKPFCKTFVSGRARNRGGLVSLQADITLSLSTTCARCLKPIERELYFELDEVLVRESDDTDADSESYTVVTGRSFDITDLVLSTVLLDIDMIFLCREDCKGLCPICGADLNEGMCDCGKENHEPIKREV